MGSGMLIEKKNTADLLPADYNPRKDLKPGDAEYEKLKRSIEQFGYVEPVIWNKTTGRVAFQNNESLCFLFSCNYLLFPLSITSAVKMPSFCVKRQ